MFASVNEPAAAVRAMEDDNAARMHKLAAATDDYVIDDVDIEFDDMCDVLSAGEAAGMPPDAARHVRQLEVLLEGEEAHMPSPTYIADLQQGHSGMSKSWRKSLVDWIIEYMVGLRYKTATYSLAVNLMDRFLSKVKVDQDCMHALAIAVCLIASKLYGHRPIRVRELRAQFEPKGVKCEHVKCVEVQVCATLGFRLSANVGQTFATNLCTFVPEKDKLRYDVQRMTLLAADIGMTHIESLKFRPSIMGLAAVLVGHKINKVSPAPFLRVLAHSGLELLPEHAEECVAYLTKTVQYYYPDLLAPAADETGSPTMVTESFASPSPAPAAARAPSRAAAEAPASADGDVDMS